MRVGIVIHQFNARRGGAEGWTCALVDYLTARGYEVHVLSHTFRPTAAPVQATWHPLPRTGDVRLAAEAEVVLKTLPLDVVHDMGVGYACDVFHPHYGSRIGQWERKALLWNAWLRPWHDLAVRWLPRPIRLRELARRQYSDPRRIYLALSRMVADDFRRHHGVSESQIRIIYNGVDTDRFAPDRYAGDRIALRQQWGVGDDETAFLWVGHNYALKGLATAVGALRRLAGKHRVRLVVLGGRKPGKVRRMAQACGVADRVVVPGSVVDSAPYYAACDAFVLPTFSDSCSLSLLEAAATGLPCITTRFNGAGELLTEGVDGFVLDDPADDAPLAARMETLLDPAVRRTMGAAARTTMLDHTFQRNCEEVEALYREILAHRS